MLSSAYQRAGEADRRQRAIAGFGSAGIFSGALIILALCSPIEKRAAYQSFVGAVYGLASVVGPLIGGAFTDNLRDENRPSSCLEDGLC